MNPPLIPSPLQASYLCKKKKLLTTLELHQNIAIQLINKIPLCSKDCAYVLGIQQNFPQGAYSPTGKKA